MEHKIENDLIKRSAKSVWKEILLYVVFSTCMAIGVIIWTADDNWIYFIAVFKAKVEINIFPFLISMIVLGVIWISRLTQFYIHSSDVTPMSEVDYHRFILMDYDESLKQTDRFVRWSYIILWCAGVFAFKLTPESDIYPFSIIFEIFKIIFYLLTFAFTSFSFLSFFVSIEIFCAGFIIFKSITIGKWWLAGLITYCIILLMTGDIKGVLQNILMSLLLAISYINGGYVASLASFIIILIFGEFIQKINNLK